MSSDLLPLPRQGYFVVRKAHDDEATYRHLLCGRPTFKGAISPNSGKPLLQLLALDARDPRLELPHQPKTFPLLYSWTCPISDGVFTYGVRNDRIELIEFSEGAPYSDFPYPNYPNHFQEVEVGLLALTETQQKLIEQLNAGEIDFDTRITLQDIDRPKHQLGGTPRLLQSTLTPVKCPNCHRAMPLLAAIANENGTPEGFVRNDYAQVIYHLCRQCLNVSCYNIAD